ncbi:MAG: hypothetical protein AB7K35_10340 [Pseudorhodoplanes sp.]
MIPDVEVKKRCIFFIGGYEPIPPDRAHERFKRELQRFEKTWNVSCTVSDAEVTPDGAIAAWRVHTAGPDWSTDSEYRALIWSDFVLQDFARSDWVRVPRGISAFADFIVSGTAWRYFKVNWRYGLFFAYPLLLLIAFAMLAIMVAPAIERYGFSIPLILHPFIAFAVFVGLVAGPGRFLLLSYMLDDWIFGSDVIHGSRKGFEERVDAFAADIEAKLKQGGYDEYVFIGHSLGCAIKLEVIDRVMARMPEFGKNGERLNVCSTGSSVLKIAFHPVAEAFRDALARVSRNPAIFWIEYQTLVDVISFYKVNPVTAVGLPDTGSPVIQKVRVRHMLEEKTYRKFKGNFFRLHRQLVMGNDRRYFYDYFMVCCGPYRLDTRAQNTEGMMHAIAPDGSLAKPKTVPEMAPS